MMRWVEVRDAEAKKCLHILDDDEFPWINRSTGKSFSRAVSVMLINPCPVLSVKLDIAGGTWSIVK